MFRLESIHVAIKLGSALNKMIKLYGLETPIQQNQAIFLWNEIVGEQIAAHTTAEKISYGKLYVKVSSPVWRNELIFQKEEILNQINKKLVNAKINEIILR